MATQKTISDEVLATRFLFESKDEPAINFLSWNDFLFRYQDGVYLPVDEKNDLIPSILRFLMQLKEAEENTMPQTQKITIAMLKDIATLVRILTPRKIQDISSSFVAFTNNNLLNLSDPSFEGSEPSFEISPWNREKIAFLKLPFDSTIMQTSASSQDFSTTRFKQFLDEILIDPQTKQPDIDLQSFIQEMFGYCLLDTNKAETAFFFYGSGANGKSVLLSLLRLLFPPHLVSASSIEQLTTNKFRLASLVGKKINIVNEEESKYLKSDIFKNIVTGEPITCERKFMDEFNITPIVKLVFATNSIPTFDGVDFALRRRLKIVPFYASFDGSSRDPDLLQKLKQELPMIFLWALEGAKRLIANNYEFSRSALMDFTKSEFESSQSSAIEFFVENFITTSDSYDLFKKADLYKAYREWAEQAGRTAVKGKIVFFNDIKNRFKDDGVSFPIDPVWSKAYNSTIRAVTGLRITSDHTAWIHESGYAKNGGLTAQTSDVEQTTTQVPLPPLFTADQPFSR